MFKKQFVNISRTKKHNLQARVSKYDFKIKHRKGNNHTNVDISSRLDHEDGCRQCNLQPNIELNINAVSRDCAKPIKTREMLKTATESEIKLIVEDEKSFFKIKIF